jgi:hypothetical protein
VEVDGYRVLFDTGRAADRLASARLSSTSPGVADVI